MAKRKPIKLLTATSFVNGVPMEELTEEERDAFCEQALRKAVASIGRRFINDDIENKDKVSKNTVSS